MEHPRDTVELSSTRKGLFLTTSWRTAREYGTHLKEQTRLSTFTFLGDSLTRGGLACRSCDAGGGLLLRLVPVITAETRLPVAHSSRAVRRPVKVVRKEIGHLKCWALGACVAQQTHY